MKNDGIGIMSNSLGHLLKTKVALAELKAEHRHALLMRGIDTQHPSERATLRELAAQIEVTE